MTLIKSKQHQLIFFSKAKDKDKKKFTQRSLALYYWQQYSLDYRPMKGITSTNQDAQRQMNEQNRFPSQHQGQGNPSQQVTIGFCFNADWLIK